MFAALPLTLALALTLTASPAVAGAGNAADDYAAAVRLSGELKAQGRQLEWKGQGEPPADVEKALSEYAPALEQLVAGTRKERCEFPRSTGQIDLGPEVPSIPLLNLGKVLVLRGRVQLARGSSEKALEDLEATLRLSAHLIKAHNLVTASVGALLETEVADALRPGLVGPLKNVRPRCRS